MISPFEALVRELLFCHPGFLAGHRNEEGTVGKVYHRCVIAHSSIPDPAIACLPLTSAFGPEQTLAPALPGIMVDLCQCQMIWRSYCAWDYPQSWRQ